MKVNLFRKKKNESLQVDVIKDLNNLKRETA